jgi:tRNA-specific adenosine deaminase 1
MELIMAAQDDDSPWEAPATMLGTAGLAASSNTTLPGRAYFSQLGIVRRKPARSDAPLTLSKSCSDKLSLKQCTSLLNAVTCLLINPKNAYLSVFVLPRSQVNEEATRRAFSEHGRMKLLRHGCRVPILERSFEKFLRQHCRQ